MLWNGSKDARLSSWQRQQRYVGRAAGGDGFVWYTIWRSSSQTKKLVGLVILISIPAGY
jgi:hypothetical protein